MAKDPARVKAGKKAWNAMSAAKKQSVLARLARGRAMKKSGRSGGGSPAKKTGSNPGSSKPRLGAAWQGTSSSLALASPVTDSLIDPVVQRRAPNAADLASARRKVISVPYGQNLAVEGLTAFVDKKMGQAAALSRNSVTAWAPEVFQAGMATKDAIDRKSPAAIHARAVIRRNAYDPNANTVDFANPEFRTYRGLKHGGQAVRLARSKVPIVKRLTDKLGDYLLRPFGLTW